MKEEQFSGEGADDKVLTPEQIAKNEAMNAPLPIGDAFIAEVIAENIKEAERERADESEIRKLHGELLKTYLDNYDRVLAEKTAPLEAQKALEKQKIIDDRELEEEFRNHGLNNLEEGSDASGFGKQYRDYLLGEEYQKEPNKREARNNWKKAFWTPDKIAEQKEKDRLATEERDKAWLVGEEDRRKEAEAKKNNPPPKNWWRRIFG